jgi:D-alanyl-lipoteichoic acid acyltransferase DltB (MBOAT superfamily)
VKISLTNTLTDFIYLNKIFEKGAPSDTYLYLWLDSWTMGRIWFEPSDAIFTYILQTRKDGE